MLTIAGGILLAVAIMLAIAFVVTAIGRLFDPYGQGRTKAEWRRACAQTARDARSLKKTQEERDSDDKWFRSMHGVSMDDL